MSSNKINKITTIEQLIDIANDSNIDALTTDLTSMLKWAVHMRKVGVETIPVFQWIDDGKTGVSKITIRTKK